MASNSITAPGVVNLGGIVPVLAPEMRCTGDTPPCSWRLTGHSDTHVGSEPDGNHVAVLAERVFALVA